MRQKKTFSGMGQRFFSLRQSPVKACQCHVEVSAGNSWKFILLIAVQLDHVEYWSECPHQQQTGQMLFDSGHNGNVILVFNKTEMKG